MQAGHPLVTTKNEDTGVNGSCIPKRRSPTYLPRSISAATTRLEDRPRLFVTDLLYRLGALADIGLACRGDNRKEQ